MIHYAAYNNFVWLWLVPAVAAVLAYGLWQRQRTLALFAGAVPRRLGAGVSPGRRWIKVAIVLAAVCLTVVSLAQPQWGKYVSQYQARGRDIIVALDFSRSMLAEDVIPSRLERAKADVRDLIDAVEQSGGHRLGLIAFAGSASLKCPLTQVYGHVKLVLDGLDSRSVARGGTMIGDAIRISLDAFDDETQNFRDVILITDGEDMESFPLDAAAQAREAGITIYTVGLGDAAEGARIPVAAESGSRRYLEHDGQVVWSRLDEGTLRQIAQATGGIYVPAGTRAIELDRIFRDVLEPKTKREMAEARRERLQHRFQWFLAPAVALLVLETLVRDVRRAPRSAKQPSAAWGRSPDRDGSGQSPTPAGSRVRQSVLPAVFLVTLVLAGSPAQAQDARALVQEGNKLFEQGQFAAARERYERAAELAPESPVPLYNCAAALFEGGDFAQAAKVYDEARARAPEELRQQINYALGNCHLRQAIEAAEQAGPAAQQAKAAIQFYRDAIAPTAADATSEATTDSARYNLEIAKRLVQRLEQKQQQQQEQQPSDAGKSQGVREQTSKQDPGAGAQPPPDNAQSPAPGQDASSKPNSARSPRSSEALAAEDAAERLRAAIARAQMARARRLSQQDKQGKGAAVIKDW